MKTLDERVERAFLRRLSVADMIHLIADQAKALTKANARVDELEKTVMDMGLRLTKRDIEDNLDVYKRLADR